MSITDPLNAGLDECFSCRHHRSSGLLSMTDAELLDGIGDLDARISCAAGISVAVFKAVKSSFIGEIGRVAWRGAIWAFPRASRIGSAGWRNHGSHAVRSTHAPPSEKRGRRLCKSNINHKENDMLSKRHPLTRLVGTGAIVPLWTWGIALCALIGGCPMDGSPVDVTAPVGSPDINVNVSVEGGDQDVTVNQNQDTDQTTDVDQDVTIDEETDSGDGDDQTGDDDPDGDGQADAAWVKLNTSGPGARWGFDMAYDRQRGVTLLCGGNDDQSTLSDLWEFNGSNWTRRSTSGPARQGHAVAFDESRGVLVLFGGDGPSGSGMTTFNETWEWDGVQWSVRASVGPSARRAHAMAYDAARQVVVLFGGWSGDVLGDTWEWDGSTWSQRSSSGPPVREHHRMVFDRSRGVTVLFGGQTSCSSTLYSDLWEWDGTEWNQVTTFNGQVARSQHALAFDEDRAVLLFFGGIVGGGCSTPEFADARTWEWSGADLRGPDLGGPSARSGSRMVYDSARHKLVLFGGYDGTLLNDTWLLEP
jgi:hypothetical protein